MEDAAGPPQLFVGQDGGCEVLYMQCVAFSILSMEGTAQGDPLAMTMYDLAVTPLIDQLKASCPEVCQVWYADDATGASTLRGL